MKRKSTRYIILIVKMILFFLMVSVNERRIQIIDKGNRAMLEIINNIDTPDKIILQNKYQYEVLLLQFINYCSAGAIFGIEKSFSERNKSGIWRINFTKLISNGIPSFLLGISIILSINFKFIPKVATFKLIDFKLFVNFMQMLFGYTITTSFYKAEELKQSNNE